MLEPPKEHPEALREQLLASEIAVQRRQGRVALGSFARADLVSSPMVAWNGITDWALLGDARSRSASLLGSIAFSCRAAR